MNASRILKFNVRHSSHKFQNVSFFVDSFYIQFLLLRHISSVVGGRLNHESNLHHSFIQFSTLDKLMYKKNKKI